MARYQVKGPDGQLHVIEGPEGASPEQVIAAAQQMLSVPKPEPSLKDKVNQGLGNLAAGAVRGAGSWGATILYPIDKATDLIKGDREAGVTSLVTGKKPLSRNEERRAAMDSALESMGAQPDSLLYKGGKLAGEVAGTAGAGGVIANGARALGAAPALVDAIASGGMAGGGNLLTRTAGGAITGAATAGMVNPDEAGMGALVGGALPGGVKLAGMAGNALADAATAGSKRLMQSAIKPTIAQRQSGDADTAIQTLLEYGINPTKGGVNKLRTLIDDLNTRIGSEISASNATVDKASVLNRLGETRKVFANQASPTSDLNAIQAIADDFAAHPVYPGATIPVQGAQEMKQGTYRALAKKYGEQGGAATEAQKALARGLKEEVAAAVPAVGPLNAQESKLITTLDVAERRALLEANKNPLGLAALAVHEPAAFAAFMADKSALFKSLLARSINSVTPAQGQASQKLLNAASNPLLRATGLVATEANP